MEEDFQISAWQKKEVLKRQAHIKNHPKSLVDFDELIHSLEQDSSILYLNKSQNLGR